jgi:hypothetical protein
MQKFAEKKSAVSIDEKGKTQNTKHRRKKAQALSFHFFPH